MYYSIFYIYTYIYIFYLSSSFLLVGLFVYWVEDNMSIVVEDSNGFAKGAQTTVLTDSSVNLLHSSRLCAKI